MASAKEIADRAMEIADGFLEASREEIARMACGDGMLLYNASQIVRQRAGAGPPSTHSAEQEHARSAESKS